MPWLLPLAPFVFLTVGTEPDRPLVTVVPELPAGPGKGAEREPPVAAPASPGEPVVPATPAAEEIPATRRAEQGRMLATLKAQAALRDARPLAEKGDALGAIALLERHLAAAEGSNAYLKELDAAYRQQVAAHIRAGRTADAALLEERRRALGKTDAAEPMPSAARQEEVLARTAAPEPAAAAPRNGLLGMIGLAATKSTPAAPKAAVATPKAIAYVARGKLDQEAAAPRQNDAESAALAKADQHWQAREYSEALRWYEAAYQADPAGGVQSVRNRYGYCLLRVVQQRCEQLAGAGQAPSERQRADWAADLRQGRALVNLEEYRRYADDQMRWLENQGESVAAAIPAATAHSAAPRAAPESSAAAAPATPIRRMAPDRGWKRAASANFVVLHQGNEEFADQTLRLAESGRRRAHEMYFPNEPLEAWTPACQIVLYPNGQSFAAANPGMPLSPALTRCDVRQGGVASRRMEFRADEPNLHPAILPHEVCHAVLAGRFAGDSPPKWADEGLAVLTEPQQKQEDHLRALAAARARGRGFGCLQAMRMPSYPGQDQIQEFYAQSVGMCRCLVDLGGREKLVEFIRLGAQTQDWEGALMQTYGIRGSADLEGRFAEFVQRQAPRSAVAAR